jgi:hypothetical protein
MDGRLWVGLGKRRLVKAAAAEKIPAGFDRLITLGWPPTEK